MFKMLNPRRFYYAVGRRKFLEFILLAVFILFFYGPLLNMLMLAFAMNTRFPMCFRISGGSGGGNMCLARRVWCRP